MALADAERTEERIRADAIARVNAWTAAMGSYVNGYANGYGAGAEREAARLKEMYVAGSLSLKDFEVALEMTFSLSRAQDGFVPTS